MDSLIKSTEAENPRAVAGNNNPPEDTPFEKACQEIDKLYAEALQYLDGDPVSTKGQADDVGNLLAMIRAAAGRADKARVEENKPFDDGKAAVQAKYADLIADTKTKKGKTVLATEACKKALEPWLIAERKRIDQEAALARKEAEEKAELARLAVQTVDQSNLAEREEAEALIQDARKAEVSARRAENVTATAGGSAGRSVGLRTTYAAVMTDFREGARHYYVARQDQMREFIQRLADADVAMGKREIPGFTITEERKAV